LLLGHRLWRRRLGCERRSALRAVLWDVAAPFEFALETIEPTR